MKRLLFGFILGLVAGAGGLWQLQKTFDLSGLQPSGRQTNQSTSTFTHALQDTFDDLTSEAVREELAATSMVVREKARQASQILMDATANARLTGTIKYRLVTEPNLPGMRINVDSSAGLVTLTGTLDTHEQIARAVRIALETEGVIKVVSTVQVQPAP